jgi:hypothetical protein
MLMFCLSVSPHHALNRQCPLYYRNSICTFKLEQQFQKCQNKFKKPSLKTVPMELFAIPKSVLEFSNKWNQ